MLYLNKKQKKFHKKMFKLKRILTTKTTTTTTTKTTKSFSFNVFLLKVFVVSLFSILNLLSTYNSFFFEDENNFIQKQNIEDNKIPIKISNDPLNEEEEYFLNENNENNENNSWFSFNNFFLGGLILFICGFCAYYYYNYDFFHQNAENTPPIVKNLAYYRYAILNHVPFELIEQYKTDINYYFLLDPLLANEILYQIQQFLDHPEEKSGQIAIKSLEKILNNLYKTKHRWNPGNVDKGTQVLNEIVFELKAALIKGHKD